MQRIKTLVAGALIALALLGAWRQADGAWSKADGAWATADGAWSKTDGAWAQADRDLGAWGAWS
jgi:hypothetical protein